MEEAVYPHLCAHSSRTSNLHLQVIDRRRVIDESMSDLIIHRKRREKQEGRKEWLICFIMIYRVF